MEKITKAFEVLCDYVRKYEYELGGAQENITEYRMRNATHLPNQDGLLTLNGWLNYWNKLEGVLTKDKKYKVTVTIEEIP